MRESAAFNDLRERIESLSWLEQLSLVVHTPDLEDRFVSFMICAYGDESGDKKTYSYSCLLGKLRDFVELGRLWRRALAEEGIPEFHSSKLEFALPPYEGLDADRRASLQRRFINLLIPQPIWGFTTFVELAALKQNEDRAIKHFREAHPYNFCLRMTIEAMAIEVDDYKVKNEPIAFVFDQQQQYEGDAKKGYDELSRSDFQLAHRLGSISFGSRFQYVELQAADAWAYESRKYVSDVLLSEMPERWQMRLFLDAPRYNISGYGKDELPKLFDRLDREASGGVSGL